MNKRYSIHFRIYTRLVFEDREQAERLCRHFIESGDDFVPTHFGANEPIRTKFDRDAISEAATLLHRTALHLLLRRTKPRWLADIYWFRGRIRPWFWTFDFGEEWLKGDKPKQIVDFITRLCSDFPPVFAAGGLSTDWFEKHSILNPGTGEVQEVAGASFNPGTGLPGIYWYNYFGKELVSHFGVDKVRQLGREVAGLANSEGVALLAYESPDQEDAAWRRARERDIVEKLGEQYFFDLVKAAGKRPRWRQPIPGATDAKKLHE